MQTSNLANPLGLARFNINFVPVIQTGLYGGRGAVQVALSYRAQVSAMHLDNYGLLKNLSNAMPASNTLIEES